MIHDILKFTKSLRVTSFLQWCAHTSSGLHQGRKPPRANVANAFVQVIMGALRWGDRGDWAAGASRGVSTGVGGTEQRREASWQKGCRAASEVNLCGGGGYWLEFSDCYRPPLPRLPPPAPPRLAASAVVPQFSTGGRGEGGAPAAPTA